MVPIFPGETGEVRRNKTLSCTYEYTHDEEAPQKLLRVVVYTTLSRALGVYKYKKSFLLNEGGYRDGKL